jgi:UDP-glucose:(heptosyl)LPS alpha-1,3-glucosyltransferase
MKKIALLKSRIGVRGGAEKVALRLADALTARGDRVTLLTSGAIPEGVSCAVETSGKPFGPSFFKVVQFDRFCAKRSEEFDLVLGLDRNRYQTHLRASNGVHAAYLERRAQAEGIPFRISAALNPLHKMLLHLEREAFRCPQLETIFTNSHLVKNEIVEMYKIDGRKIRVVHNGVEWSEMETPFSEITFNSRFEFLFIGNNYARKGLHLLLAGLALIKNENFHLNVVGKEKNASSFCSLAEKLGLAERVTFHGKQSDMLPFYKRADALVIPSLYDPFANVTVEALAMGLFVVSSKANGGCEVIAPHAGTLIDSLSSPDAMAAALKIALANPKTPVRSHAIRDTVAHLDYSKQLELFLAHL